MAWVGDPLLETFTGSPVGGPGVVINVTINATTQKFGQQYHVGNMNLGSGTINVTVTGGAVTSGSKFAIYFVSGAAAVLLGTFTVTAGWTVALINNPAINANINTLQITKT